MKQKIKPTVINTWRSLRFWQEILIYYWLFSLAGHYYELLLAEVMHLVTGQPLWKPMMFTVIPLAGPYGLGVIAIIIFVVPLMTRYKLHPITVFTLNAITASVVEYLCALVVVAIYGRNQYWDYSNLPLNFQGYISLGSSLIFAILATFFIYYIYPYCEKFMRRIKNQQMAWICVFLLVITGADMLWAALK